MQISAKELRHLANDVDDMHHEAMRTFKEEAAELHLGAVRERRTFLKRSGLAAVGGTLLATGGGIATFTRLGGLAAAQGLSDTQIAGYAQSIELAAVAAYMAAAPKLSGDVLDVATLFAGHHQDHADAFGAVAGDDARPEANPKLVEAVTPTLEAVGAADPSDELTGQILAFARDLENQAAYTYAARAHPAERPRLRRRHVDDPPHRGPARHRAHPRPGGRSRRAVPHRRLRVGRPRRRHRHHQGPRPGHLRLNPTQPDTRGTTHDMDALPDLNRDELRRELKAIDADNRAVMPKWYDALRQIVGGGTKMSTDEKAALLGVPAPGRRSFFKLGGATIMGAAVLAACGDTDDALRQRTPPRRRPWATARTAWTWPSLAPRRRSRSWRSTPTRPASTRASSPRWRSPTPPRSSSPTTRSTSTP